MIDTSSLVDEIIKSYQIQVAPYKRAIIVDSIRVTKTIGPVEFLKVFDKVISNKPPAEQVSYTTCIKAIVEEIIDKVSLSKDEETVDLDEVYYTNDTRFPFTKTLVLTCPIYNKHHILFNTDTEDYEYVHVYYYKDRKIPKEVTVDFRDVVEVYNPKLPSRFYSLTEQEREEYPSIRCGNVWNTYTPPKYLSLPPDSTPKCHPVLVKFFKHLFPDQAPRLYVLRWLRTMISDFDSTLPILLLCGKAGVGKNTLVENIMVGLVGIHNYHKAAQQSERFNSSIANCTLHFTDEGEVNGIVKRNLKSFHELYVAIERKGVDVTDPERIFARFTIATNNKRDINLDYNDRKFSVPEITDRKLLEAFTQEEQDWLFGFKHNLNDIRGFRDYLIDHYTNVTEPYHGRLFDEICFESLPSWFRSFIKICKKGEEFGFKAFKRDAECRALNVDTLLHKIDNYEHQTGVKLCEYYTEDGVDMFKGIKDETV